MLSISLILFSADGWGCVPSLLFDLRPDYGGGDDFNGDCLHMLQLCTLPCGRPQPTHASARDSWTLLGKSGPVSQWVAAPFS